MTPIPEPGLSPKVVGGKLAKPADWPVTLIFATADGYCTSTVVGDHVIITAAHCVKDHASANAYLANLEIHLTCFDNPLYAGPSCSQAHTAPETVGCTADVALCLTDIAVPAAAGKFERIKKLPPGAVAGQQVVILGYGCTVDGGAMSPNLQYGESAVEYTSTPNASQNPNETLKEYIKTKGGAASCSGDSGGSLYSGVDKNSREILGVTSRGNMSTDSYFVNVLDDDIVSFLKAFRDENHVKICGLDADAVNCRF
jgi:Trypsin